ncbi:MAG: hypothetical protein WD469_13760 [Paenibacillaceae bacterium]
MEHTKRENQMDLSNQPYFQFQAAIERLEEEHSVLSADLSELCTMAEAIDQKKDLTNWIQSRKKKILLPH